MDSSYLEHPINPFECLPNEVVTQILLNVPYYDLKNVAQVNSYFARFLRDKNFWADKAFLDLNLSRGTFLYRDLTIPIRRYYYAVRYLCKDKYRFLEATRAGDLPGLKLLIAQSDVKNLNFEAGLVCAVHHGNMEIIRYMIDNRYAKSEFGYSSLYDAMYVAAQQNRTDIVKYFLSVEPKTCNWGFVGATQQNHLDLVKDLIGLVEIDSLYFQDAIVRAAENGHLEVIQYLTNYYFQFRKDKRIQWETPIYFAKRYDHTSVVQYLIEIQKKDI